MDIDEKNNPSAEAVTSSDAVTPSDAITPSDTVTPSESVASSQAVPSPSKRLANHPFEETFDEYFKKFLDTESSELNDYEIRKFTQGVPKTFILTPDRYETVFKVLFKIKEIPNKAVLNDTVSLLQACFSNVSDFNKFLADFWSCDEIKMNPLGPIGYSFSDGKPRYDFSGVLSNNNDVTVINAKAIDAAFSMVLDVQATVESMLDTYMNNKPMSVFYLIILRRFKCLGDYKIKVDGKYIPIFLYFYRKLVEGLEGYRLDIALSCLVSVTWSPVGHYCWSLMKPNFALCEIMNHLTRDDEHHKSYMLALRRLFTPITNFRADIEWQADSLDFDNQTLFLFHFMKYFNRKHSTKHNEEFFFILECFKKSLRHLHHKIENLGGLEEAYEVDWPFVYCVANYFEIKDFKYYIPGSIAESLPESEREKYVVLDEAEPSLEKALTGLMELYFILGRADHIPDAFYKNLWNTHPHPKSVFDLFAKAIVRAYNGLKLSVKIGVDKKFIDFISRVSQYCLDYSLVESFSSAFEVNFDLISRTNHLIVAGRTLRLIVEDLQSKNHGRRPAFENLPDLFHDLFKVFAMKTRDKFTDIRNASEALWPPWRKGAAACMDDERSMAINHFLNAVQKEAFCIYDSTFGQPPEFLDFLFFLYKQRRHFGMNYGRLEEALHAYHPDFFNRELSHVGNETQKRVFVSQNNRGPRRDEDNRGPRGDGDNRGSNRDGDNRGPRGDGDNRGPRRDENSRGSRGEENIRGPRRDGNNRGSPGDGNNRDGGNASRA